ncbi:DNA-binding response regulator [Clostridium sp. AF18-27]|uniref:response regulator transcription factor n=1 Tax=Enterocloster lavalensis TaxID=460384 RepID=UPI000E469BD0|nr:response regulator transcription factor [Enterocloster lavalensis]MBS5603632.1 response regulator transcription factor [Enterocloster asparagiformis]MCB6343261.1 response regulator transcription factor [Enterocloster lavalensis]RHR49395.1 DNA-binding response regulator [Clostridium sp. AF18-27]
MKTILIIEDDISIARLIKTYVSFAGYEAAIAPDGELALVMLGEEKYNLVILDLMLPHVDGEMVLETIKKLRLPVIVVSAKSSLVDRVRLLRAGADDYITKPFESADLIARIEAVLRRTERSFGVLEFGDIAMDIDRHVVRKGGREVDITPKEFDLLQYFLENRNKVVKREELSAHVWGQEYLESSRTVEIHVQRLRKKMGLNEELRTVTKVGYILEDKREPK